MSGHSLSWTQGEIEVGEESIEQESDSDMNPTIESLAMMAVFHHRQEQEQLQYLEPNTSEADRRFYGYGEAGEDSVNQRRNASNSSNDSMPSVPGSPLPADRLARKQRNFPRRGGYCHNALLKSAVTACMSDGLEDRNGITAFPGATPSSLGDLMSSDLLNTPVNSASPRKRIRRTDHSTTAPSSRPQAQKMNLEDEAVIARATDLLQRLCMKPLDRNSEGGNAYTRGEDGRQPCRDGDTEFDFKSPLRRVSRRTSYTSQISAGTDYEDLYDELEDDAFL